MSNSRRTSEPVVIVNAVVITLHTLFAGGVVVQGFIEQNEALAMLFAFGNLATVALQAGLTAYQRGVVVPLENVSERVYNGLVLAGPANDLKPDGAAVREIGDLPPAEKELIRLKEQPAINENRSIYPGSRDEQQDPGQDDTDGEDRGGAGGGQCRTPAHRALAAGPAEPRGDGTEHAQHQDGRGQHLLGGVGHVEPDDRHGELQ